MRLVRGLLALFVLSIALLFTPTVGAQEINTEERLAATKHSIVTLQELARAGKITSSQLADSEAYLLSQLSTELGRSVPRDEIMAAPDPTYKAKPEQQTWTQWVAGYITFINILFLFAVVLGVVCFFFLFGRFVLYIVAVFVMIPAGFYEVLLYLASITLVCYGWTFNPAIAPYIGLTGCLFFAGALLFSASRREMVSDPHMLPAILTVVWGGVALWYGSSLIGFFATLALMATLGFTFHAFGLGYAIGFEDENAVGRATSTAFLILGAFIAFRTLGYAVPQLKVFETGSLLIGSFVGYLGLLITSSRWYPHKRVDYVTFQVITIIAGFGALFFGAVLGVEELLKVGGTFFVLYIIEKYIEIPAPNLTGYATLGLIGSGILYAFCSFTLSNQEMVSRYLLMPF